MFELSGMLICVYTVKLIVYSFKFICSLPNSFFRKCFLPFNKKFIISIFYFFISFWNSKPQKDLKIIDKKLDEKTLIFFPGLICQKSCATKNATKCFKICS